MPERRSSWYLLSSLVDQPRAALADIFTSPRRRWILPVILALLTMIASAVATAPYLAAQAKQQMASVLNAIPADQVAQVQSQMGMIQSPVFVGATAAVTGIVGLLVGWLVQSALLYFGALIAGGEVEFRRIFAAAPWLGLPLVLGIAVETVHTLVKRQMIVNPGLSYLVSSGKPLTDARTPAYVALSSVTLFWLWHLILVYIAAARGAEARPRDRVHPNPPVRRPHRGRADRAGRVERGADAGGVDEIRQWEGVLLSSGRRHRIIAFNSARRDGATTRSSRLPSSPGGGDHECAEC